METHAENAGDIEETQKKIEGKCLKKGQSLILKLFLILMKTTILYNIHKIKLKRHLYEG